MTMVTLIKENIQLELAYSFGSLVHYHSGGKHGGVQIDMVLEKELRAPYVGQKAAEGDCPTGHGLSIYNISKPTSTLTHFLQQDLSS